ncbi:MAG: ferritin-like domain-containing protein, partial [Verrucomicrobiota bacterium]
MKQRVYRHLNLKPAPTHSAVKREALGESSLPPKPPEMAWRDYLVLLLHIGAELEHCLMVEYLYAAYSLGGEQVPKDARSQGIVRRWRDQILSVAREEMGHLLTVQNVLCLLGGPVTFDREDFPWDTVFYPFPFRLEPLTLNSLACYVYAEMPPLADLEKEIRKANAAEFKKAVREIRKSVVRRVPGR